MKNLQIIGSNEQVIYHDYFKPYQCKVNGIFPKMYNGGWNDYHFEETVNFSFDNMPLVPKLYGDREVETDNYKFYSCQIQAEDITGKKISGYYYITFDKKANKFISENVDFS